jgi:Tfp pilus assembly protein FimV
MFERSLDTERLFEHDTTMHRTYVRRRRTLAIVGTALVAVLMSPLAATAVRPGDASTPVPVATQTVVVQPGDTLWSIAQRVRPAVDPRETIAWIQDANDVDAGGLEAGRSLVVPAA